MRAKALRLAERPEWRKLMHYVPNLIAPGMHSLVDSPGFFQAANGKTDPQAELEATLVSFGTESDETGELQHPQCAFVARRAWLDQELGFDPARLPLRKCRRFQEWRAALAPERLTLVFASAYLNNPSSMYGHTLLRIDAAGQDERTRLLAYTLNFYADTNESNGAVFVFRAMTGGYPGKFSTLPYYLKVREYNDMENRDLWEYELGFSAEEVERLVQHVWEIQAAHFDYYFFDENCAYHLLRLLQVARPDMDLASEFRWWAIPSDTVRAVVAYPGLVQKTVYRPSSATVLERRLSRMTASERALVMDLSLARIHGADPKLRSLPPDREAAVLEAGADYARYRAATGLTDVADPAELVQGLLLARSRNASASQAPEVVDSPTRPELGHGSLRVSLGAGRLAGTDFQELRIRPTYHDLLDAEPGYAPGAQIEFLHLALRHYSGDSSEIESFTPLAMVSLSPRDEFFGTWSWKFAAGWWRSFVNDGTRPLATNIAGGGGAAWSVPRGNLYAFFDAAARFHPHLEQGYGAGLGATAGALLDPAAAWRVHLYVQGMSYFLGEEDRPAAIGLEQRLTLGRNAAVRLDLARKREAGTTFNAGSLSLMLYH